ncbi:unnamed protein product [Kuraishia capsulata CBS 1993]|uniref:Transcription initiation factor IIA gamma subunit C-terminal domain-containing protein n=1 Tax=Kuraishia capsulata CBS 1993 TaxID=1382522 RepID=W6MH47_9ASCO|nr:uncharacterized protein KUCA_T00001489001 [Kuraishia capsulata CBS 1993]CDK25519.1 unnamed protein product [Kuraishia capsulata CBS 1993]
MAQGIMSSTEGAHALGRDLLTPSTETRESSLKIEPGFLPSKDVTNSCVFQFDRVVSDNLKDRVKAKLAFKGHLHTYRFCDDVWTFIIKDVNIKLDQNESVTVDKFKIVACNSRRPGET